MSEDTDETYFQLFINSFSRHSSPIDWCEANYEVVPHVAEFYNTISNSIFFLLPAILVYLFHPYGRRHSAKVHCIWFLMMVIGAASAYFHATLSLAGQLLDEFGILWVFNAAIAFWLPRKCLPGFLKDNEQRFDMLMLSATVVMTVLGCFWPIINSFVLMCCSIPALKIMQYEMKNCKDERARYMAKRSAVIWVIAAAVWLSDRLLCGLWQHFNLPGGHWLWHLLVGICTYQAIVFFAFTDAVYNCSEAQPVLKYWPYDNWTAIGIPYVHLKSPLPELNGNCFKFSNNNGTNGHHKRG